MIRSNLTTEHRIAELLADAARRPDGPLGKVRIASLLVLEGGLSAAAVTSEMDGFTTFDGLKQQVPIEWRLAAKAGTPYCTKNRWVPLRRDPTDGTVDVACMDPPDYRRCLDIASDASMFFQTDVRPEHIRPRLLLQCELARLIAEIATLKLNPHYGSAVVPTSIDEQRRAELELAVERGQTAHALGQCDSILTEFKKLLLLQGGIELARTMLRERMLVFGQAPPIAPLLEFCKALEQLLDLRGLDLSGKLTIATEYRDEYRRRVEELRRRVKFSIFQNMSYVMYGTSSAMAEAVGSGQLPPGSHVYWVPSVRHPHRAPRVAAGNADHFSIVPMEQVALWSHDQVKSIHAVFFGVHAIGSHGLVVLNGTSSLLAKFPSTRLIGLGGPRKRWVDNTCDPEQLRRICALTLELEFIPQHVQVL